MEKINGEKDSFNKTAEMKQKEIKQPTTSEIFGRRIEELRVEFGYGKREFAAKLGISHASLSNYVNGERTPNIELLKRCAEIFHVKGDYLIGLSNERRELLWQNHEIRKD